MPTQTPLYDVIDQTCQKLGKDEVSAKDLAASLGKIESQTSTVLYVTPSQDQIKQIIIIQDKKTGQATSIEWSLASADCKLQAMQDRYGKADIAPQRQPEVRTVLFPDKTDPTWKYDCVLSAKIETKHKDPKQQTVREITLQRESR